MLLILWFVIGPPPGSFKINRDASWKASSKGRWGGIILRNSDGRRLIDERSFKISASSAFIAEASLLREACLFSKSFEHS